jgi:hypothetical protein
MFTRKSSSSSSSSSSSLLHHLQVSKPGDQPAWIIGTVVDVDVPNNRIQLEYKKSTVEATLEVIRNKYKQVGQSY